MQTDQLLQFRSLTRGTRLTNDTETSSVINALLGMCFKGSLDERPFSQKTLDLVQTLKRFSDMRRVCLVRRLGASNQLQIVCASDSNTSLINKMPNGYSCFVNPNGSLFLIQPGTIRLYQSASQVVESFARQNKPPQRSIFRIAQMGLLVGYCLPLFDKTSLRGFLFLNRDGGDSFGNEDADYSLFSCLSHLALTELLQYGDLSQSYSAAAAAQQFSLQGEPAETKKISQVIQSCLAMMGDFQNRFAQTTFLPAEAGIEKTLISHANIGFVAARILDLAGINSVSQIGIKRSASTQLKIHFSCQPEVLTENRNVLFDDLLKDAQLLGLSLAMQADGFSILCYDDGPTLEIYSVEQT